MADCVTSGKSLPFCGWILAHCFLPNSVVGLGCLSQSQTTDEEVKALRDLALVLQQMVVADDDLGFLNALSYWNSWNPSPPI